MTVAKCIYGNNKPLLNKNSLRTIEVQFVQKRKNNDTRPKFTGSYKKSVYSNFQVSTCRPVYGVGGGRGGDRRIWPKMSFGLRISTKISADLWIQ